MICIPYLLSRRDKKLFCTNPQALVRFVSDNHLLIEMKAPAISDVENFHLIMYGDSYRSKILANWIIEVSALEG